MKTYVRIYLVFLSAYSLLFQFLTGHRFACGWIFDHTLEGTHRHLPLLARHGHQRADMSLGGPFSRGQQNGDGEFPRNNGKFLGDHFLYGIVLEIYSIYICIRYLYVYFNMFGVANPVYLIYIYILILFICDLVKNLYRSIYIVFRCSWMFFGCFCYTPLIVLERCQNQVVRASEPCQHQWLRRLQEWRAAGFTH